MIEAGPTYFDSAVKQVGEGIDSVSAELAQRDASPYGSSGKISNAPCMVHFTVAGPPCRQRVLADDMTTTGETHLAASALQHVAVRRKLFLPEPTRRTAPTGLIPIKYIPLRTNDPSWYLTLGGELRERFEGNYDPNFGIGGAGANSYLLQRITLLADLHLGERVRIFTEGISGVMEGESQPAPPVQQDPIDLQFAFLDVLPYLTDDESLTLRAGRFGMSFGSGRLVATRAAPNIPFRFDGFEAIYSRPLWEATAFLTRPVEDNGSISGSDPGTTFWGLYLTHWFDAPHQLGVDLYYLGIHNERGYLRFGDCRGRPSFVWVAYFW